MSSYFKGLDITTGQRVKEARKKLGIGQREMASKIGYEWHKIKNIETAKHKLTPEIAKIFEEIYSISGWWLLTGSGEMFINKNTININVEDYNHSDDIKEIIEMLKFAPNSFLSMLKNRLSEFKALSSF